MKRRRMMMAKRGNSYDTQYLTFVALEDETFSFTGNDIEYSVDDGTTWVFLNSGSSTPTVHEGERIMWRANGLIPTSSIGIGSFSSTGNYNAEGNVMSMLFYDNYIGQTDLTGKTYAFFFLFKQNEGLISAKNLSLPATILSDHCYYYMFFKCTSLIEAPKLPATTLKTYCYSMMFSYCSSLETAPELPAMNLDEYCYMGMFGSCASLVNAPELPATKLKSYCYMSMFGSCTSLITAPILPATNINAGSGFARGCYNGMFVNCRNLNYIEAHFLNTPTSQSNGKEFTINWVLHVAATGTYVKNYGATYSQRQIWCIPDGWTVQTKKV